MILLKADSEIEIMRRGGEILSSVMENILFHVRKGVSLESLDKLAEAEIVKNGAKPSFKMVDNYKWSICVCVNEVVVHGIPTDYQLQAGDIIGIDCGVFFEGYHTDSSWTVAVPNNEGEIDKEIVRFLKTGQEALNMAISRVKVGNYIYDISSAIQETIEKEHYSVVKTLIGHGIGKSLHEDPEVPCFVTGDREKTARILPGLALAIEVIYNMDSSEVVYGRDDGWTIITKDGKISGLFETTVVASNHGVILLTKNYGSSGNH